MSRRIFVIRHGNTFASSADARRVGAGTDIPLVDSGMAQAQRLASYFAARSLVGESVRDPYTYYTNNVTGTDFMLFTTIQLQRGH